MGLRKICKDCVHFCGMKERATGRAYAQVGACMARERVWSFCRKGWTDDPEVVRAAHGHPRATFSAPWVTPTASCADLEDGRDLYTPLYDPKPTPWMRVREVRA